MKKTIRLEENESDALAIVLDMLRDATDDDMIVELFNECGANIGVTVDDVFTFLADIFHRYV